MPISIRYIVFSIPCLDFKTAFLSTSPVSLVLILRINMKDLPRCDNVKTITKVHENFGFPKA
jgi:hypothetical protein